MHEHVDYVEGQVRSFSRKMRDRRVQLTGLKRNERWNGRRGKIVKLVMEGEDFGRWKVKLDKVGFDYGRSGICSGSGSGNGRGGDPDGVDGRDSLNGEIHHAPSANPDGNGGQNSNFVRDGDQNELLRQQEQQHVVAKAENLILLDSEDVDDPHVIFSPVAPVSGLQPRTKSNLSSKSKDPDEDIVNETQLRHDYHGHATVTPEKDEYDTKFHLHHHYNNPPGYYDPVRSRRQSDYDPSPYVKSIERNQIHHSQENALQPNGAHSQHHRTTQRQHYNLHQQQPNYKPQSQSSDQSHHSFKSNARSLISPPPTKHHRESSLLSTAFSNMLLSPVTFEPVSFTPSVTTDGEGDHHKGGDCYTCDSRNLAGDVSVSGSFFEEVTPRQYPNESDTRRTNDGNIANADYFSTRDASEDQSHFQVYPNMTPTLVILTDNDDPIITSFPPPCIGIKEAGIPYVNGVYLLTTNTGNSDNNRSQTEPPVYFKDGPPVLLSNNRYYDMCILRIPCPDSSDHVIWFLARVDIDPDCEDVKFSDCYYYCRMLRTDGVENDIPPERGWKVPSVPPGVNINTGIANEFDLDHQDEISDSISYRHSDREDHGHIRRPDHGSLGIQPMNEDGSPRDLMFSPAFSTFSA